MNALARRSFPSQAVCGVLLAAAVAVLCLLAAPPAPAQTMTNTFGGFSKNSNEPIDIESDVLVVHDGDAGVEALLVETGTRGLRIAERGVSAKRNAGWRAASSGSRTTSVRSRR